MNFKFLLSSLFLSFTITALSQQNVNDPFSSFGIGESTDGFHPTYQALGNTSAVQIDSLSTNFYNPSSYSNIAKGQPIFSVGINTSIINYIENGNKERGSITQISHFAFGISFAKIVGFAFGLKPFTRAAYHINTLQQLDDETAMRHQLEGEGNTNLFFGGLSVNALNLKQHKIGIGFNMGYLFGNTQNKQSSYIDDDATTKKGTVFSTTHFVNSFYYDLGINYQLLLDNDNVIFGATYRPQQSLKGKHIYEKAYSTNLEDMDNYAYIESNVNNGKIILPQKYTIGLRYILKTKRSHRETKLNSTVAFSVQYSNTQWSKYREEYTDVTPTSYNYANEQTYGFGIEYTPQYLFLERVETGYMSKVRYRIGSSFSSLPFSTGTQNYKAQTFSAGFGFPFLMLRSTSSINFSVSYNHLFNPADKAAFQKNFFNFSLGISFAPGINDRWFRKYKID